MPGGSVLSGVVAVCGRSLEVVSACGSVPGCGLGYGWRWALGWCVVCGLFGDGAAWGGGVVRSWRGAVLFLCW